MSKINRRNAGSSYIDSFPVCKKWINECACCHRKGYKPEMPDHIVGELSFAAVQIKKHYSVLSLNEYGLCEVCAKLNNKDK
ncbi:MAG: hypothetical protein K2K60_06815 [Clostridia bacterium]|nr:hypothetical protein [Clostridia bacterium]